MNTYLTGSLTFALALSTPAIPPRTVNQPRAGKTKGATVVWTNIA
jgi:hypothetical protein